MKLTLSTVTKLVLEDLERLDPVTLFLEDLGVRACPTEKDPDYWTAQGQLTVRCYGESWTAYWGGMGRRSVVEFIQDCNVEYLLNCLNRGLQSTKFCAQALQRHARGMVLKERRSGFWDKEHARELWTNLSALDGVNSQDSVYYHGDILEEVYGQYWIEEIQQHCMAPNEDYDYLHRIVTAAKAGITLYLEQTKHETGSRRRYPDPTGAAD